MSRKGRTAAPAISAATLKPGAAAQPFRDARPLPQGSRETAKSCIAAQFVRSRHLPASTVGRWTTFLWERPCVAKGPQSGPGNFCSNAETWGCCAALSRRKAAPTRDRVRLPNPVSPHSSSDPATCQHPPSAGGRGSCRSGLVSRKGRTAAPAISAATLKPGAAAQPFRDARPLLQGIA